MREGFFNNYTPLLISIPLTVLTILIFKIEPDKYQSVFFDRVPNRYCYYIDLECDEEKEFLALGETTTGVLYLMISDESGKLLGQFNLNYPAAGKLSIKNAIISDINGDKFQDIIVFTQKGDSVLLNVFDYRSLSFILQDRYITRIGGVNEYNDYILSELCFYDANKDGINEFYFSIAAGFAINPRRIFRYDFFNDSLIASLNTGASYLYGESFVTSSDFYLFVSSSATGNVKPEHELPYSDTNGWIFNFDKNLELRSNPIRLGTYPSGYIGLKCSREHLYVFLQQGETRKLYWKAPGESNFSDSMSIESSADYPTLQNYVFREDTLYYFVTSLNSKQIIYPKKYIKKSNRYANFLNGRIPIAHEHFRKEASQVSLFQNPISFNTSLLINKEYRNELNISDIDIITNYSTISVTSKNSGKISLIRENESWLFNYSLNPAYKLRYLSWLGIFLSINTILYLTLYFQRRKFAKQSQLEKQLSSLQLQNLRNQLDPHFTFNALNSVANAIFQEKKEDAYDLFQRFTRMIRSSLMTSNQVFQSLEAELQFTIDYLEFQKTRFKGRFDYIIEIDDLIDVDQIMIPSMIVQGFAENSVKHAFHKVNYKGIIHISASLKNKRVEIIIEDNGIGIKHSKELNATSGTQKGEKLLSEIIQQINKYKSINIQLHIIDKADAGIGESGTCVQIIIAKGIQQSQITWEA